MAYTVNILRLNNTYILLCMSCIHLQNQQANAMQASACALSMLSECGKYDVGKGEEAVALRLHCGMGRWVLLNGYI